MSEAARMAESLSTAYQHLTTAKYAASKHRHRGHTQDWRKHINGLHELVNGMETTTYLVRELAAIAKACADDARAHYSHGTDPDGREWENLVVETAHAVDRALSRLRKDLEKVRVSDAHNAIALLRGTVQNARRHANTEGR